MLKEKKLIKNTSALMIFNIAKMLFPFITLPYLTRVLSTETYGMVAYVKTVMGYLQLFIDFGFVLSGTKEVVNAKGDKERLGRVVGDTILGKTLLGIVGFFGMLGLIGMLPVLKQNILYVILSYIVVFLSIFLLDFLFRGLEIMHIITIRFVVMKVISTVLTFLYVKSDSDILLVPTFDIGGSLLAVILVFWEFIKLKISLNFSNIKVVWYTIKESFVYFLSNVASTSFNALSTLIIGVKISMVEVAYWSVCMQVVTAAQACYTPISDAIYPEMIRSRDLSLIKRIIKIFSPILVLGCVLAYVLAEFGMLLLGGEEYVAAVPIFRLLIPVLFFGFFSILFGWSTLGAIEKAKETTISTVVSITVNILLLGLLIVFNKFTLVNVAIARCITEVVLFGVRFIYFIKYKYLFTLENR